MGKPKILLFGKLPPPYMGPAIATEILLNSALKEEFELIHFDTKLNKDLQQMGKWSFSKFLATRKQNKKLRTLLQKEQPDLALVPISQTTMGFMKDAAFVNACNKQGVKILVQLRGSNLKNWLEAAPSYVQSYVKKTLSKCNGVIVLGNNLKYLFTGFFSEDKIHVVPNGANYHIPAKNTETINVLYLANFMRNKGFDILLQAFAMLPNTLRNSIQLHAVGEWFEPAYKPVCEQIIQQHNMKVHFHPPAGKKEKMQHFANASLFVFVPIAPEGLPWVTVEAMAAGLPIIATPQGAIPEVVNDGDTGFVVPAGNPKVVAEKIQLLLEDKELLSKMSLAAKQRYQAHFTEEKMVEKMAQAFHKTLAE